MIFISVYMSRAGAEGLKASKFDDSESRTKFRARVAEDTAMVVHEQTEEPLLSADRECKVISLTVNDSLARSIVLVVVMQWSEQRKKTRRAMRRELEKIIRSWVEAFDNAQVKIVLVDPPAS